MAIVIHLGNTSTKTTLSGPLSQDHALSGRRVHVKEIVIKISSKIDILNDSCWYFTGYISNHSQDKRWHWVWGWCRQNGRFHSLGNEQHTAISATYIRLWSKIIVKVPWFMIDWYPIRLCFIYAFQSHPTSGLDGLDKFGFLFTQAWFLLQNNLATSINLENTDK